MFKRRLLLLRWVWDTLFRSEYVRVLGRRVMDPTTVAPIETISAAGYVMYLDAAGGGAMAATAISEETGET